MLSYVMRKMYRHLADLLFLYPIAILIIRSRVPTQEVREYDSELVNAPMQDVVRGAAIIGFSFALISIILVYLAQYGQNALVIIAAIFISVGTARQIGTIAIDTVTSNMEQFLSSWASVLHLLAKSRPSPEWRSIESQAEKLFTYKELEQRLPAKINRIEPDSLQLLKYLDEHKWELGYQSTISGENNSCLKFAQYTIDQLMQKLGTYNPLIDIQQKNGGATTVIFIAIGTLIWLVS